MAFYFDEPSRTFGLRHYDSDQLKFHKTDRGESDR